MPEKGDLRKAVQHWLEESGYPLEMLVANEFRKANFQVSQSEFYSDPETGQQREIDVVASDSVVLDKAGHEVQLKFVVECKTSRDKPWVMFTSRSKTATRYQSNMGLYSLMSTAKGLTVRVFLSRDKAFDELPLFSIASEMRPAYGMVQALRGREALDMSYAAQMQAAKATIAKLEDNKSSKLLRLAFRPEAVPMVCPVIVFDGRLFAARLDARGEELELIEVVRHFLVVPNLVANAPMLMLHVVTRQGLAAFVSDAAQARDAIVATCRSNATDIEKALKIHKS